MKPQSFYLSWVDFAVVIVLLVGVIRGRKRGMSEEILDVIKWAVIVVVAGFVYEPSGRALSQTTVFSLLSCYLGVYLIVALLVMLMFSLVRSRVGEKLVSADAFGDGEYYLGMVAGAFRYACILLVVMAFLNARYYTPQEISAEVKFQNDNFGSIRFPTLVDVQQEVFDRSFTGRAVQDYLHVVLIRPTAPEEKGLGAETAIWRRRENTVNEVLEKK